MRHYRRLAVFPAILSGLALVSCQHNQDSRSQPIPVEEMADFHGVYEQEIREILLLARANQWEEAETQAGGLHALDPDDIRVERVYKWVMSEAKRRRDSAMEAEIASITAQDSRFNPTFRNTFVEPRRRGLSLPSDVRQTVESEERARLIPDSYGRVITEQGPMFDLEKSRGPMVELLNQRVTVQVDQLNLERIIFDLGREQGINFVADRSIPAFQESLSVNMVNARLSEFLSYVSRNLDVHFQIGEDLIWILSGDAKEKLEETRFYRLRRGFIMSAEFGATETTRQERTQNNVTTVTETQQIERFVRDNAPAAPALETAIENFFTGSKVMVDYERNLIIARGTHEELKVLERLIEELDTPVQQVLIEARFVTVTRAAFLQLGVSWETGRDPLAIRREAVDFTGFGTNVGLGLEETFGRVFSRDNLTATLSALEQSGESQTLSSPRITVVNNRPATISDGKVQYYYEEYTVSQTILERRSESQLVPKGRPTKLTSGVSLDVLASIGGDGRNIMLALRPKVSTDVELVTFATVSDRDDQGNIVSTFDIRLPESRDQELATRVIVQSGETVVMGGVMQRQQTTFTEAVPILGNLPIVGAAFRKRTEIDQPRYLLIFVTATLLSETGAFLNYTMPDLTAPPAAEPAPQ